MSYIISLLVISLFIILTPRVISKYKSYKTASASLDQYYYILDLYDALMETRRIYHQVKVSDDKPTPLKERLLNEYTEDYNLCIQALDNPENYTLIQYLPEEYQKEIEDIKNSPRYNLI